MSEPIVELPENPTPTELLHAATSANNYADKLQLEVNRWRAFGRNLTARANDVADPLPDEALEKSLEITGVKTKTVRVCDLKLGDDFVLEGVLYNVTMNNNVIMLAAKQSGATRVFYNPGVAQYAVKANGDLPWTTEVLTNA